MNPFDLEGSSNDNNNDNTTKHNNTNGRTTLIIEQDEIASLTTTIDPSKSTNPGYQRSSNIYGEHTQTLVRS